MKYFRFYSGLVRFTLLVDSGCRVEGFMGNRMRSIGVVQAKDHKSQREIIVLGNNCFRNNCFRNRKERKDTSKFGEVE